MARFSSDDSRLLAINKIGSSSRVEKLEAEINSLHQIFDRFDVPKVDINGKMTLGQRFESMLQEPNWMKIK
jgi:hypothetical protein